MLCAIFYTCFLFRLDFTAHGDIPHITLLSAAAELEAQFSPRLLSLQKLSTLAQTTCCPVRQPHGDSIPQYTAYRTVRYRLTVPAHLSITP